MLTDPLILSDVGLHAVNNASAGGVLVDATEFKLGDSRQNPTSTTVTDILGATLFSGRIHHVEVLNRNICRFTFEVSKHQVTSDTVVSEVGVYLSNSILLGRAVLQEPVTLYAGETTRFNCLLATNRCDLTTINVTVGDYSGLASTPFIHQLQSPAESTVNAVTVLNGLRNIDGSDTPIIAMRYSGGAFQWAFSEHTRIYNGKPSNITPTTMTVPGIELEAGELCIVHVVSGGGVGQTRRYSYQNNVLTEADNKPLTGVNTNTTVAVWKRIFVEGEGNSGACRYPPSLENIPRDWVLTRGVGDCPVWAPPKQGAGGGAILWTQPSRLRFDVVTYTGTGDQARYPLSDLELENVNYVQPILGGVSQHRGAFDMSGNEIEFAENLDVGLPIELRMMSRVATNGSRIVVGIVHYVGDGHTQTFRLAQKVENANYVKIYVRGVLQSVTNYTYDDATQSITLVAPVASGMAIEVRSFSFIDDEGFSTQISTHTYTTRDDTHFIELPFFPQSADYIEVSQSGAHIHSNLYTLIGNKVILAGPIRRGLEVEVTLYDNRLSLGSPTNNLQGVVVDAVLTGRSLKLLRHGAPAISLPIPGISLEAGPGMRITGTHPQYKIESLISEQLSDAGANFKASDYRSLEDTMEIMYTHRVHLTRDVLLTVHADFSAVLGPGFQSTNGMELCEYVVGFRTSKSKEADYGLQLPGTGKCGFNALAGGVNDSAYANASMTQVYDVIADNHKAGYVDIVVKMRVKNANVGQYGSLLTLNTNIIGSAKVT